MATMRPGTYRQLVERVLDTTVWVQQDVARPMGLETAADRAYMSPFHFHRVFRSVMRETFDDYIRRLRLERAAHYLKLSPRPIGELAQEAGYARHAAFTRAFGDHFGTTPTQFRDRYGAREWITPAGFGGRAAESRRFEPRLRRIGERAYVESLPPLRVAFVRQYGLYRDIATPFEKLARWASKQGLWNAGSILIGAPQDDPAVTPPERVRYDACLLVDRSVVGNGEVGVQNLPGGDYATATLFGCSATWEGKGTWLACSFAREIGRLVAKGPALEFYHNSPIDNPPSEVVCDLFIPLGRPISGRA